MRDVQLFVKFPNETDYTRLDLFDDEKITITQSIKNSQDISKIFTDYTRSFTVPASRNNNKLFKHYYNFNINDGFDARKRIDSKIEINSIPFKTGRLRLDGVDLKGDKPYAYKLTFFGSTIKLKDAFGEEKLSGLDIVGYMTTYNAATIKNALQLDPKTNDFIVPLITHSQRLTYGTGAVGNSGDLKADTNVDHGVYWDELKYALRVDVIVQAIADKYGFTISNDSFFNSSNKNYYDLFMWLHRKKGGLQSEILENLLYDMVDGFNGTVDTNNFAYRNTAGNQIYINETRYLTGFTLNINNPSNVDYTVSIRRDGEERLLRQNVTQTSLTLSLFSEARDGSAFEVFAYAESSGTLTFTWTAILEEPFNPADTETFVATESIGSDQYFLISDQIPDMKVIDFLSGLFKMFNLVAEVDENNILTVKDLDKYYEDGSFRDISRYIDNTDSNVDVAIPYAEIEYKYSSSGTILSRQYSEIKNREWGSDSYNAPDNLKEGGKFTVEIPFEHMQFERLVDVSTSSTTDIMYGYYVDDNQDSYIGAPLLFYPILNPLNGDSISFVTSKDGDGNFNARDTITGSIVVPSNSRTLDGANDVLDNLHFIIEGNEYTPSVEFYKTLFYNYHFNYIASLFNIRKRMTTVKAILPVPTLINYSLADLIAIQGNRYRINSITTDLNTGESTIQLLNEIAAYELTGAGSGGGGSTEGGGTSTATLFASISGETEPNEGTTHIYSSSESGTATGLTSYEWSVSSGGTIVGSNTFSDVQITWGEVSQDSVRSVTLTVRRPNNGNQVTFTTQPYLVTVKDTVAPPPSTPLEVDIKQSGLTPDSSVSEGAQRVYDAVLYGDYDTPVTYNWGIDGGTITGGQGTSRVFVTWDTVSADYNGSISVFVSSDDGQTDDISYGVTIINGTAAPYIDIAITGIVTPVELGEVESYGTIIDSNITTSNPDIYSWSIVGGTIDSGQFSDSVVVTWDTEGIGTISVDVVREGQSGSDSANIEVQNLQTIVEITGGSASVIEGDTVSYGSNITGNTVGTITYAWSATKGEIVGGSYDGNGNSVLSGTNISAVDVTWGIYELGTGTLSLTATRQGINGFDSVTTEILGVYYVFNACDGGETVISRFGRTPDYVGGQGETFVDYSGPSPIYYQYANSSVNSTAGWTVKSLQAYEIGGVQQFGCPSEPPPPERTISLSGPFTAPTEGGTATYTVTTDPSNMGWTIDDLPLAQFNPIGITFNITGGTGTGDVTVTFAPYNGNGTETLRSQIRVDDGSSDIFSTVEVSQSPPPLTTYYIFTPCDSANWGTVMAEFASAPAINQRAVGSFSNYYTYSGTTTTDANLYSIATLTLEATSGCPAPPSCTRYEVLNEGNTNVNFIQQDCTTGGYKILTVTPLETRSVCSVTGTFEYASGNTNYTITELGAC
jgi:hypothetical protein